MNVGAYIVRASPGLLVDTSAWIEVFRRRPRVTLEQVAGDLDRVVTCLPIIQEVLQGFDDERAFRVAHNIRAFHVYRLARLPGTTAARPSANGSRTPQRYTVYVGGLTPLLRRYMSL